MQPFNCIVQRRIHCSPVRYNRPNEIINTSRPKYPVTTTCLPFTQDQNLVYIENQPKFQLRRNDSNQKGVRELDNSQSFYQLRQQQRHTIQRRDTNHDQLKINQSNFNQILQDFTKELKIQTSIHSEEYVRVWYQNLALKTKLKML